MTHDRVIYTKEEIHSMVKVPAIVESELRYLVEERLKQCGLYYRLFSRIKTADSLARKYQMKVYGGDRKIQDLIGIRIDVYFEDDLKICQKIMESLFHLVEWSETDATDVEFKPMKINGVFRLPNYLRRRISDATWDMAIDDTIEIQFKTVFFEGWHEIEHDMKYKGGELWEGKDSFSRYFNSILATLELCDKSVISLFENLGHDLYKDCNWAGMMKAHFRLKMQETPMYPELEERLDREKRTPGNLGKKLYKTSRSAVIEELLRMPRPVPINVNTLIALANQASIHDEELTRFFREKDVFDDDNDRIEEEVTFRKMEPLRENPVFLAEVNLSTYKYDTHAGCLEAARLAHQWVYDKYGQLYGDLPDTPVSFERNLLGYRLLFRYEPEKDYWKLHTVNVDLEAPGQVWVVSAECYPGKDGRQMLRVSNSYATAGEKKNYLNRYFSCPRFYSNIADRIGVFDVRYCSTSRRILKSGQVQKVQDLILDERRHFPVCLIFSAEKENGWLDEDWMGDFRVYDFTRMAGRYTHIYTGSLETGRELAERLGFTWDGKPCLHVFRAGYGSDPDQEGRILHEVYRQEDIEKCQFGRHHHRSDNQRYNVLLGGQAFYYRLLQEMRDEMMVEPPSKADSVAVLRADASAPDMLE